MRDGKKEVLRFLPIALIRIQAAIIFSLLVFFLFSFGISEAQVCINCSPADMSVSQGDLANLPITIIGGELTGLPADFYIWKTAVTGQKTYLGPDLNWTAFADFSQIASLGQIPEMVQGAEIQWPVDTTGMESFTLNICFIAAGTPLTNGADTPGAHCGDITVNVVPVQQCSGVYVYDASGAAVSSVTVTAQAGVALNKVLSVKDSCGNPIAFTISENLAWLSASSPQAGTLSLTFLTSSTVSGSMNITAGGVTQTLALSATVGKTGFNLGGGGTGGGTCTPSIRFWPNPASFSGTSGGAASPSFIDVNVSNNCTSAALSVTTSNIPNWLSVTPSLGKIRITPLAGQLPQSSTTSYISVSSAGLPTANLAVSMSITGPCVPSSTPMISPSSVSLSILQGAAVPDTTIRISNGCSNLDFTVTAVTGSWLSTVPAVNASGSGTLTAKVNSSGGLVVGSNTGSIQVNVGGVTYNIPVNVSVNTQPSTGSGGEITNKQWYNHFYIKPGEIQYYYINATASTNPLWIAMESADTIHTYNTDMLVKYIGSQPCSPSTDPKPTKSEYDQVLRACPGSGTTCTTQLNGYTFYMNHSKDSYETVSIPQHPAGCFYVMLYNADTAQGFLNLGAQW